MMLLRCARFVREKGFVDGSCYRCMCVLRLLSLDFDSRARCCLLIPHYAREVRINTRYMCHVKV